MTRTAELREGKEPRPSLPAASFEVSSTMSPEFKGQCQQVPGSTSQKHCNTLRYYGNVNLRFLKIYKAQKQEKVTEELKHNPSLPPKAPRKHTNSPYTVGVNTALPQYAHNSFW